MPLSKITHDDLWAKLVSEKPRPNDRAKGYVLVNVAPSDEFEREHIPGSINVTSGELDVFCATFAFDKEIILYGGSGAGEPAQRAARELADRGFSKVCEYTSGIDGWRDAGGGIETGAVVAL